MKTPADYAKKLKLLQAAAAKGQQTLTNSFRKLPVECMVHLQTKDGLRWDELKQLAVTADGEARVQTWLGRLDGTEADALVSVPTNKSKVGLYGPETAAWRDLRSQKALERVTRMDVRRVLPPSSFALHVLSQEIAATAVVERRFKMPVFASRMQHFGDGLTCQPAGHFGKGQELVYVVCPDFAEHYDAIRMSDYQMPRHVRSRMLHELLVTGAKAHHYCSYHPQFPAHWQLRVITLRADELIIELGKYNALADRFLDEVKQEVAFLCATADGRTTVDPPAGKKAH